MEAGDGNPQGHPFVVSVQVGMPVWMGNGTPSAEADEPSWFSGIVKRPVAGPVRVTRTGLEGDGQGDTKNHGGPDKAVLMYAAAHYPDWRRELGVFLPHGAFGENCTIAGLTERDVCIGDTYALGDALLQVTQPRQPCWKLSRRWNIPDLMERTRDSGRGGWYLRVLREGEWEAGMPVVLVDRPFPGLTVAAVNDVIYGRSEDSELRAAVTDCPLLAERLRKQLTGAMGGVR